MLNQLYFNGTIEVTGAGEVEVSPDEAVVSLTVLSQAKTAAEAAATNAARTLEVLDAVSAEPNHGVTTTGLGVSPITTFDPETNVSKIVGFRATNTVEVKTKPLYAGRIYDAGVQAGANQSSGISFRVQDERPYREAALRIAVKQAYADARVVAETAAVKLEGPMSIEIDPGPGPIFYRAASLSDEAAATPVIPEELTIAASVRVVLRTKV